MEVILIEDVLNLGKIGDQVSVAGGYARNYLIPQKLAMAASVKNRRRLEHEKRLVAFRVRQAKAEAQSLADRLGAASVTIARKVGEQDKLYGSVTVQDIHKALEGEGIHVDRRKLMLEEPIKELGVFEVPVRLQAEVQAQLKVWVVAE